MGSEMEAAGALATAGLVAGAIEGEAARPHGAAQPHSQCANCGAALTGAFCQACGQAAHIHRSLLHLAEELLHGLLHFDAKAWRTLPLLVFRPGLLTRRYIDGQRMRYVSPLALFLFTMFLMFFVFSMTTTGPGAASTLSEADRVEARADLSEAIGEAKASVAKRQARLDKALRENGDVAGAQRALASARQEQHGLETALAAFEVSATKPAAAASAPAVPAASPAWAEGVSKTRVDSGHPAFDAALQQQLKNPELALYKLKNTAYKFSFMLIPISLPFLWLMFVWRRGVTMYDHAVFSLYSLSFMSLLFSSVALLSLSSLDALLLLLVLVGPPLHMFAQLRGTYALGRFSALWRTMALLCVAGAVFVLFLVFIVAVSVR